LVIYCAPHATGTTRTNCAAARTQLEQAMRRLSHIQKLRLQRLRAQRWRGELNRRRRRRSQEWVRIGVPRLSQRLAVNAQLFEASAQGVPSAPLVPSTYRDWTGKYRRCLRLQAPADFRLHANADEVLAFIYEFRRQVFVRDRFRSAGRKRAGLYLDLDTIEEIDLEAALVLTAEIDRVRLVYNVKPFMDDANWQTGVRAILYGLGLYRVVDAARYADAPPIDGIETALAELGLAIVPFISCHEADPAKAQELRASLWRHCATSDEAQFAVYDGLVEAFSNAVQHAYRKDVQNDGLPTVRRWWAGGLVDKANGEMFLVVYDQGAGIPKTLVRRPFWHRIAGRLHEHDDASVIEGALEYGRSGTASTIGLDPDADGRGNGLWRMCEMTSLFPTADVRFTSLQGQVLYARGGATERAALRTRFCGTMIRWRAQIGPAEGRP
jgi:hypothetical protein